MTQKTIFLLLALALWVCSCVEPFELKIKSQLNILTVDATLTDLPVQQSIKLSESANYNNSVYSNPVLKANVWLLVNGSEKIDFTEQGAGIYVLPKSFQLKTGNTYKLFFSKSNGTIYESGEDKLTIVPKINKVYDEFELKGIDRGNYFDAANYVYLDTNDPAGDKNNYLWSWRLWEKQSICITCSGGRYFTSPAGCRLERNFASVTYDYNCNGDCWEILSNKDLNVFSDIYSNGQAISNKLVAKIPYYNHTGALIEVKQQSISPEAYRYFKLLTEQVQSNGSLVDTPPAALVGNIRNTSNNSEAIAGFFMVTSVQTQIHWIDRRGGIGLNIPSVNLLDRTAVYEPAGADLNRPPLAPCILSQTRTPNKPNGWGN